MTKTILAIIGFALAIAIFLLYTEPTYGQVGTIQAQIAQYSDALNKAAQFDTLRQTLLTRYNSFDPTEVNRLQTMLPDDADDIGLILDLNNLAANHGMALENVDVNGAAASASDQTAVGAVGAASEPYDTLTLEFTTYGTYQDFEGFIQDLQSSLRLVDLVTLNMSPQTGAAGSPAGTFRYDMTIQTYWLK